MKILLCDDSMTVRKKLTDQLHMLDHRQFDILEAVNGEAAVAAYRAHHPTYVIMDIMMPVKDGLTALEEIMVLDPKAKVIMLSSLGTKENLKKALQIGAIDFIQKPVDMERLEAIFANTKET